MNDQQLTRRRALQLGATASAGLVTTLAGCGGGGNGGGTTTAGGDGTGNGGDGSGGNGTGGATTTTTTASGPDGGGGLSLVPASASVVARVEVRTLLDGPVVRQGVEESLSILAEQRENYSGPTTYEEVLQTAEGLSGLDPRGLRTATAFWAGPQGRATGAVMETDWAAADLVGALETTGPSLSESSYGGKTIHVADQGQTALGVLGGGRFVLGSVTGVRAVVDVANGDASPVAGAVVSAFERAPSGPVRFGADLSDSPMAGEGTLSNVETVWGGMGVSGTQRRFVVSMDAGDPSAAKQLSSVVEQSLQQARSQAEQSQQFREQFGEVLDLIDQVQVTTDGATVSISYATPASEAGAVGTLMAAVVASFVLGIGSEPRERLPQVSFGFEYDADAGTVTITHRAGDSVPADRLFVVTGDSEKSWASLSDRLGPSDMVAAGERVTVEMAPDETVRVVFRGENRSATLAQFQGPDA